ncbi:MAG: acetyl-CoA carboxylase, carboxyltransferase subunit beta [Puniceicoccales bacterium]|jgi:acetyl-CoA carboxylase carboxyl transferase subunit beta|nr:acetyl-CoA carboxylase, carboxyltransferase subunit beta [Puniceicoccales bacterium]
MLEDNEYSQKSYFRYRGTPKDIPSQLWIRHPQTGALLIRRQLEDNGWVDPKSGYHFPIGAQRRIQILVDLESFQAQDEELISYDPLNFSEKIDYAQKLVENQKKTGLTEAVLCGSACMDGMKVELAVMDFRFLGASMGSVVGERITRTIERGLEKGHPVIIISASGGARMYEGILSLMQMAKTAAALARLGEHKIPFISVLTHPTTGGVTASFATLGDIILAEPGALIGFAGPRVIEKTTGQKLPSGFQTAEFLLEHGLIDQIVPRNELRDRLIYFLKVLFYKDKIAI